MFAMKVMRSKWPYRALEKCTLETYDLKVSQGGARGARMNFCQQSQLKPNKSTFNNCLYQYFKFY